MARFVLRPMATEDIPAVAWLERTALVNGWDELAYERELRENPVARYLVLEREGNGAASVVGFGGIWLQVDEAHIVTVAVDEEQRRQGLGSLLVLALLDLAAEEGMSSATLEVRVSNAAARALYRKFGFREVGARKAYYSDNLEDAVIMSTPAFDDAALARRLAALRGGLST